MSDIFEAIQSGDLSAVRQIIDTDPDVVRSKNPEGLSPLIVAAYWGQSEILDLLRQTAGDLDSWEACIVGDDERVRAILAEEPAMTSAYSPDGFTGLHLAVFFGWPDIARRLISAGSNVLARTTNALDNQPLHAAVAGSKAEARLACTEVLVNAGAAVNERQSGGFTPLMAAAQNADTEVLRLLLAHGADPSLKDDEGRSAADHALTAGHTEIAVLVA